MTSHMCLCAAWAEEVKGADGVVMVSIVVVIVWILRNRRCEGGRFGSYNLRIL